MQKFLRNKDRIYFKAPRLSLSFPLAGNPKNMKAHADRRDSGQSWNDTGMKIDSKLFLILILAIAAFLRLYRIGDYMTFLGDEGRDVLVVYNILHGHFTLLGPTASVGGFFLGPIYYYMMAPFLWLFNYDPVGPAVMIALLGVVTVWFVYFVTKEFFGRTAALIAAGLYATSPLVITYSRSSWNPNPMPFFTLLCLFVLYRAIRDKKVLLFAVSGLLFGIMMQLHYLATFVGVIIAVYMVAGTAIVASHQKKKKHQYTFSYAMKTFPYTYFTLDILYFVLGFLIGFSTYLAYEIRHGFANIRSIIGFVFHSKDTGGSPQFFHTVGDVGFRVFGRLITSYPSPDHFTWYPPQILPLWFGLTVLLILLTIGVLIYQVIQKKQTPERLLQRILLLLWLGIGVLLFGLYKKSIYDYYFEFMFPLPFILVANMFVFLWNTHKVLKVVTVLSLGLLLWVSYLGAPFQFQPNRQLNQMRTISKFVLDKTDGKPFNFALITGGNSDHAYRYFMTIWGHPPVTIENTIDDPSRKSVTDQLLIVCESLPCAPLGNSLFEVAGFGRADIAGHWKVSVVEVYKLVHYKGK